MKKLILLTAILAQALVVSAQITITGQLVDTFTGGDNLSLGPGTAGFSFTTGANPLTVQAVGIFDADGGGLTASHQVGIWDATTTTLVGSATVPTSGTVNIENFLYIPVTPLTLQANHSYVVAAQYADVDFDLARGNASGLVMNGATYGNARLSSGIGFDFPDVVVSGANAGFFGPNLSFTAVPEPSTWGAVTAGALAAWAAIRRWKARQNAGAAAA